MSVAALISTATVRSKCFVGSAVYGDAGHPDVMEFIDSKLNEEKKAWALIEQGYEMGRPSLMELTVEVEGGKPAAVRLGGQAVRVASGRIEV